MKSQKAGIKYTLIAFHKLEIGIGVLLNHVSMEPWCSPIGMKTSSPKGN